MATLISVAELAIYTGSTIASDDPRALMVIELASGLVCDEARHPDWETTAVPPRAARRICFQVAARTYTNPELEVAYGIGPLSGRTIDWAAYGLTLTPPEEDELGELRGEDGGGSGLWVLPIAGVDQIDDTVYVPSEPGLQTIPYLDPNELDAMTPEA